jgi:hypothetical protein
MSIENDAFKAATTGLKLNLPEDRLRGAFVRRRARHLSKLHSDWNAGKLATQLKAELAAVESYLSGRDALVQGTEATAPRHLDLRKAADAMTGLGSFAAAFVTEQEKLYRTNRAAWVPQIVWLATALHASLWQTEGPPPQLERAALDELLDRRLRTVEQMSCNVNAARGLENSALGRRWRIAGPNGPWIDGLLVRNFEYPVLPKAPFEAHLPRMKNWSDKGASILFEPRGEAPIHFPKEVANAWLVRVTRAGTMWVTYQPSTTRRFADVLRRMFSEPRADFMERCWLYCDMVVSALNLEALWLANRRRRGNDEAFEAVANKPSYVVLGPVLQFDRVHDLDVLMADDQDPFFENVELGIDDLQVGDFVLFWNSRIYDLIASGAWRNEFSLVMRVDPDGSSGKVRTVNGPQIWLAGHGVNTVLYAGMATELVRAIGTALTSVRQELTAALGADASLTEATTAMGQALVLWSPYERFDPPGAWWLAIPNQIWHDEWDYATIDDVLRAVPRTVAKEAGGTGYNPPEEDVVYFPLYEPIVGEAAADGDSWRAYLRKRKADQAFRPPTKLVPLTVDGRLAVGLFYRGAQTKFPVVRPRQRV